MRLPSEHRLLRYTLEEINRQRVAAGVTPITSAANPTGKPVAAPLQTPHPATTAGMTDQQALQTNSPQNTPQVGIRSPQDVALYRGDNLAGATASPAPHTTLPPERQAQWSAAVKLSPASGPNGEAVYVPDPVAQAQLRAIWAQEDAARAAASMASSAAGAATQHAPATAAAASPTATAAQGLTIPTGQARQDRQAFIEQKRAEGLTDTQIRELLLKQPQQTAAPAPATSDKPGTVPPVPQRGKPAEKAPATDSSASVPGTVPGTVPSPRAAVGTNLLRNLAATEADPITKALMLANADYMDANPDPGQATGQAQFMGGADAKAISTPYDAIQKILDMATATAKSTEASKEAFLQGQFDRNDKTIADQQAVAQAQLEFARHKDERTLADANKKKLDSQTIILALQGGFGSADGNAEIADARLKGEQAIVDLNKEYGFKMADVSLQFTQMHNQAFDKYQTDWLAATDAFEAKVSNLDIQGISNQQAKGTALSNAYKDYVGRIKEARTAHANAIKDATKTVYDAVEQQKVHEDAKTAAEQARKDRLQAHEDAMTNARLSREASSTNHQDTLNNQAVTEAARASAAAQTRLKDPKSDYSIYQEASQYTQRFNDAYDLYTDPNATGQDRAAATAQAMFQFSHGQNPGSLRIQDIAGEEAIAGLSLSDKAKNEVLHWTQGGAVSQETLDSMKTLMDTAAEGQKQKALLQIVSVWHDVNRTNLNLPRQPDGSLNPAAVRPEEITGDPELLDAIYQQQDREAADWLKNHPPGSVDASAMRTDRNNNPIAAALAGGRPNQFTKALDDAGIPWAVGDPFPGDSSMSSIKILGDPIEGARAILAGSNAIQTWYINHTGKNVLPRFGVTSNKDFAKLPPEQQNAIIKGIYESEGGNGSLFASNQPSPQI